MILLPVKNLCHMKISFSIIPLFFGTKVFNIQMIYCAKRFAHIGWIQKEIGCDESGS